MKPSIALKKALKLIEKPEKWGKGEYECDGRYCASGALIYSSLVRSLPAAEILEVAFDYNIIDNNDDPSTTHADVVTAYLFAIELAKDAERGAK